MKYRQVLVFTTLIFGWLGLWTTVWGGTGDTPTSWANFVANAYELNGISMRDGETSADPTQGSASVTPSRSDISSGYDGTNGAETNCNPQTVGFDRCGLQPSVYYGYYDGGTTWDNVPNSASMNDDFIFFRMRVDGDPRTGGLGLNSTHWNYLIDVDNDGFKEFWIDVDGSDSGGPNSSDIVNVYYDDSNSQQVSDISPAPVGSLVEQFTACRNSTAATGCTTSHSRAYPVSDLFPGDTTGEYFVEVQVPITAFDDLSGVQQLFPDTPTKYIFSTSASNSNPLQKDFIPDCPDPDAACTFGDFTPVTLSFFEAEATKTGTVFHWATSLETSNLGFDLWLHNGAKWAKVNPTMIASEKTDSMEPQEYMYFAEGFWGERFRITDNSTQLKARWHGPFKGNQPYGQRPVMDRIDWAPIADARMDQNDRQLRTSLNHQRGQIHPAAVLKIRENGIYRVTFEELLAAGLDFRTAKAKKVALTLRDQAIPIYVNVPGNGNSNFGPGSYFEFYGQANQSLYSLDNVYQLRIHQPDAKRMSEEKAHLHRKAVFPEFYLAETKVEYNREYSFSSPNGDPWFMEKVLAFNDPVSLNLPFETNNLVTAPGSKLILDYWGVTNYPIAPDHHLRVHINQIVSGEDQFDGLRARQLKLDLPIATLQEGSNLLQLELPADTGAAADLVHLESFTYVYPRAFVAEQGQLIFHSSEKSHRVSGLPDQDLIVYRLNDDNVPTRLSLAEVTAEANGFTAKFASNAHGSYRYWVSSAESRSTAAIEPARPITEIKNGPAEYLIISHPMFLSGLSPLVQAKTNQGLKVKVVNVDDIYDQFSGGNFDPIAIRDYIRHAAANQNVAYVLLVGGDSYDYHHYKFPDAFSFIPTIYAPTQPIVRFSPVDALLVDLDGDEVPDLPLGRFPVRSLDDLTLMIDKTLGYAQSPYPKTAIFAADQDEANASFTQLSEKSIQALPQGWDITRSYIDALGLEPARRQLIDKINTGVSFANFFGHSGPTTLSFQNLFTSQDAETELTNDHAPLVFAQWGCWNAYFVYPGYNTLADKLLLSGPSGAAAVIGAATLTDVGSANLLGDLTTGLLTHPEHTLGSALLAGKQTLAKTHPALKDVILGMMLLGDPALVIQP